MTISDEIAQAIDDPEYGSSVRRVKEIAARSLREADTDAKVLATRHFNHTYLPDFVMKWPHSTRERFVFLRASAYAEELEEDVVRLADCHPVFLQLSDFQPVDHEPVRPAIDSLDQSASTAQALVATMPAIGRLDNSPNTGRMLSSFVMRGGRGVIEDAEAESISQRVESGFDGALSSDRAKTAEGLEVVEGVLDPSSTVQFTRLFEAAWISGGASAVDFPGGQTTIGEQLSSDLLRQLLDIVPESSVDFWERMGNAVTLEAFSQLHLVGDQPRLQHILRNAVSRLIASKHTLRRTQRSDQASDPFIWQVDNGYLSLRGGGYQGWIGTTTPPPPPDATTEYAVDPAPSLSRLSARAEDADVAVTDIGVEDSEGIVVRVSSTGGRDVATSDLVERVTGSLGESVQVKEVIARVNGKNLRIDYDRATSSARSNSRVAVAKLVWTSWNLFAAMTEEARYELGEVLGFGETDDSDAPEDATYEPDVQDSEA